MEINLSILRDLVWDIQSEKFKNISDLYDENGGINLEAICKHYNLKLNYIKINELEEFAKNKNDIILSKTCCVKLNKNNVGVVDGKIYIEKNLSEFNKKYALAHALAYYFVFLKLENTQKENVYEFYNDYVVNNPFTFIKNEVLTDKVELLIDTFATILVAPFYIYKEYDEELYNYLQTIYKNNNEVLLAYVDEYSDQIADKICDKYKISKNVFYKAKNIHKILNELQIVCH